MVDVWVFSGFEFGLSGMMILFSYRAALQTSHHFHLTGVAAQCTFGSGFLSSSRFLKFELRRKSICLSFSGRAGSKNIRVDCPWPAPPPPHISNAASHCPIAGPPSTRIAARATQCQGSYSRHAGDPLNPRPRSQTATEKLLGAQTQLRTPNLQYQGAARN